MRAQLVRIFIILGIFAPLMLIFSASLLSVLWPGYDYLSEYLSVLGSSSSPLQILVNILGFGLFGLIMMGFSLALGETLEQNNFSTTANRLLLGGGLLISILGFFPTDRSDALITASGKLHSLFAVTAYVLVTLSIFWHGLAFKSSQMWGRIWLVISYVLGGTSLLAGLFLELNKKFYFNGTIERIGIGATLLWIFLAAVNCFLIDKFRQTKL